MGPANQAWPSRTAATLRSGDVAARAAGYGMPRCGSTAMTSPRSVGPQPLR